MATRSTRHSRRRAKGIKPRARKPKVQQYPELIEKAYIRDLRKRVKILREMVEPKVLALLEKETAKRADSLRADADKGIERLIFDLVGDLVLSYERRIPDPRKLIRRVGESVDAFNRRQVERQVGSLVGFDVLEIEGFTDLDLDDFMADNLDLIQSITNDYRDDVQELVLEGFKSGKRPSTIAKEIMERGDITERRAQLIARDQIEKLNGKITEQRQTAIGIDSYIWRTSQDGRVRDAHREREGKTFRWDDPPEDGHPGQPINCRCRAEPDIEDFLSKLEEDLPPE